MRASYASTLLLLVAACSRAGQTTSPAGSTPAPMAGMAHMAMPGAGPSSPSAYSAEVRAGYDEVRRATARYKSLDSAVAHGYPREVAQCYADSIFGSGGAMGYHHVNRALFDRKVEIDKPEILMYERTADGAYNLVGVEYLVLYRDWPKDSVPPTLMGRPMMQENERNYWYSHMWIWKPSTSGLFADWNPAVKCPPKGTSGTPALAY